MDLILHNASFLTMDAAGRRAAALGIRDGRIAKRELQIT